MKKLKYEYLKYPSEILKFVNESPYEIEIVSITEAGKFGEGFYIFYY